MTTLGGTERAAERRDQARAGESGSARAATPEGVVLLTDQRLASRPLPDVVRAAVEGGLRWVVLREKELPREERLALAERLRAILAPAGGTLVVAGPDPLGGTAVHLPAAGPYPPPRLALVGRSCHDRTELARLSTEDYVTLSPVYPSRSKPGYGPPLDPAGLAELVRRTRVPVLALGGVTAAGQVAECLAMGAAGVAVMGAVMTADDPARLVRSLVAAADAGAAGAAVADAGAAGAGMRGGAAGMPAARDGVTAAGGDGIAAARDGMGVAR